MSYALSSGRIKSMRKAHRCFGCERIIPKGSPCSYFSSPDGGNFYTIRLCAECGDFLEKYPELVLIDGEYERGNIGEHVTIRQ